MNNFFKPEDFQSQTVWAPHSKSLATIANEKLNALFESWPVVYVRPGPKMGFVASSLYLNERDTHKARLAFIEEIVKEPCKHEPMNYFDTRGTKHIDAVPRKSKCTVCGVELVAEFKEKK